MVRRITLEINLEGGQTTAREVRSITERFEALQEQMRSLSQVSQQLGTGIDQTEQLLAGLGLSADQASAAINGILLEQQGLREAGTTIAELNLSQTQGDVLANVLGDPQNITQYINQLNQLNSSLDAVSDVAGLTGGSIAEAEQFIEQLGLSAEETARAIRTVQAGNRVGASEDTQRQNLRNLRLTEAQSTAILERVNSQVTGITDGTDNLLERIALLSVGFNQALQALQTFAAGGAQAYDALILQNERLNQQILSVQASLVANTDIFQGDRQITDPTEAILALETPVREALARIERDSLELVGVVSSDLVQVFQILAQQTEAISNQSATLADPLEAASQLTIDFAATLGTLGIPLFQARQEIQSILTATIDQNSVLAKSLGITNEQVRNWRQQGTLVDSLSDRLEPFVEGNALAARSISGITSNLQEVFEIVTRTAGETLYDDIVDQLQRLFDFVSQNQDAIAASVESAVDFLRDLLGTALNGVERIAQTLLPLATTLRNSAQEVVEVVEILLGIINTLLSSLEPLFVLIEGILNLLNQFGITEIIIQSQALLLVIAALDAALLAFVSTLFVRVIPAILTLSATIAPLIPLLTALGIGIAALSVLNFIQLGQVNDAIDALATSTNRATQESLNYAQSLKELNDLEEANGALTAEQTRQREALIAVSESSIAQNNLLIEQLRGLRTENNAQANSVRALIRQIEASNEALAEQAGIIDGVRVQSRALLELGRAFDQIQQKVEGNLRAIARGTGDLLQVQQQAQEAVSLIQRQLEAGVVTTDEAIANLLIIATNTRLTYEEQLAGQSAIFAALIQDVERQNQTLKRLENERLIDLQTLLNQRLISEAEFNRRQAQLTTIRIQEELRAETERLNQIDNLDLTEEEKQEEIRQALNRTTELQLQLLQQEKNEREAIVALVRDQEQRITAAIRRENSLIVSGLREQQDVYTELNRQIERQRNAQDFILRNLETESRLINSISEVENARRNLINTEGQLESDRLTQILELRRRLNSGEIRTARERREIIFELQRLDGFNSRANRDLQNDIKRLEEERFSRQIQAQQAEQARARTLLDLEIQRNEATAQRAITEARIAENQARQQELSARITASESINAVAQAEEELNVARAAGDTEQIANAEDRLRIAQEERQRAEQAIELARDGVSLAQTNVSEAEKQLSIQQEIAENSRLTLDLQQRVADVQLEAEARARGQADELERGANEAIRLATALNTIQSGIGIVNGELVTVEGRRGGGAMTAGQPYVVGEGIGGKFIPGVSEIIVPKTDSYAIASDQVQNIFEQGLQSQITNNSFVSNSISSGNLDLLNAARAMQTDIQGLRGDINNLPRTTIEGAQIINQFSNRNEKKLGMKFARDFIDEIKREL